MKPKKTEQNGDRDNEGRFIEGNKGKPKGAANHTTKAMKKILVDFLHDKVDDVQSLWKDLDNREKIALWLQVARLVMPKPDTEYDEKHEGYEIHITRQIIGRDDIRPVTPPITWINTDDIKE